MFSKINTASLSGIVGHKVVVETDIHRGMPGFYIVGRADATIREAFRRIKPAIMNSGYGFPGDKVTVNLVPASIPKEGSHFDLPIAVGIIIAEGDCRDLEDRAFLGEVSLDGRINSIRGALPLAMGLRKEGIRTIVLPEENAQEVAILEDIEIIPVKTLKEAAEYARGTMKVQAYRRREKAVSQDIRRLDFSQVIGQESAKRALLIAAAGRHGVMMMGSSGCGKTMMARRITGIMPNLSYEEKLEITVIYSIAGLLSPERPVIDEIPFRSPHHTVTRQGLLGGGIRPRPGEMSLAHKGVLFLDEFGEFDQKVIDAMRQPVEEGVIRISRSWGEMTFPSDVMLIMATNPCKCGNLWDDKKECICTQAQLESYRKKLAGPLADRIDMHIRVNPVEEVDCESEENRSESEDTLSMREKVMRVHEIQERRYEGSSIKSNSQIPEERMEEFCSVDKDTRRLLHMASERNQLTMRGRHKLMKVARTIADLDNRERIMSNHMAEALMYRFKF